MTNRKEYSQKYYQLNKTELLKKEKTYRILNKVKIYEMKKKYRLLNKNKIRDYNRKYSIKNARKIKKYQIAYDLKTKYAIDLKTYSQLLINQNHRCGICKIYLDKRSNIHVDHNHSTGKVRGLLCPRCNFGLGYYKDDINIHQNAINYLKETNENK
jgi:hypothetical protein